MSSKDIGPAVAVDPNLSLAAHEPRTRAWAFDAEFYSSIHPALVSDSDEIAANYIQEMLNTALVAKMVFFSFWSVIKVVKALLSSFEIFGHPLLHFVPDTSLLTLFTEIFKV